MPLYQNLVFHDHCKWLLCSLRLFFVPSSPSPSPSPSPLSSPPATYPAFPHSSSQASTPAPTSPTQSHSCCSLVEPGVELGGNQKKKTVDIKQSACLKSRVEIFQFINPDHMSSTISIMILCRKPGEI